MYLAQKSPSLRGSGLKWQSEHPPCDCGWSPSLRGSGLKLTSDHTFLQMMVSPSLRGSGLKSILRRINRADAPVSLFTREWIEILIFLSTLASTIVSLFTREWIEIADVALMFALASSPSLRGSGLKLTLSRN